MITKYFEQGAKGYLTVLLKHRDEIIHMPYSNSSEKNSYITGYLSVVDSFISTLKTFLEDNCKKKDFIASFKIFQQEYHLMHLALKKNKNSPSDYGEDRAASDLDKELKNIIYVWTLTEAAG
jgi:hypothetical protein